MAGVTETLVPKRRRGGEVGAGSSGGGGWQSVEIARTISAKGDSPGPRVLDRKTERVKFYRTVIITSKLSNRKKVTD